MTSSAGAFDRRQIAPSGTTLALRVAGPPFGHESSIAAIAALIAADPDSVKLRFGYACCLEDLGRNREAQRAYVEVLEREPEHFGALTNMGSLLHNNGNREVARAFYTKAVVGHPDDPMGHLNLGNALLEDGELEAARFHYEAALKLHPGYGNAHFCLSLLFRKLGDADSALRHHQLAFARPWVRAEAYHGTAPPLRILVAVAANGGNVVTTMLLDNRLVQVYAVVAEGFVPSLVLPEHHVFFNAIGDADRSPDALLKAAELAAHSRAPIVNDPRNVLASGRSAITDRLRSIPGVVTPRTELLPRTQITAPELERRGFAFPLLLRSPGFHTGKFFELVERPDRLAAVVAGLPGEDLFAIEYLSVRGGDDTFRKYRAIIVGERLYPLHLAIARQWKVHYFSADMREQPGHRAEEAAFLADMRAALSPGVVNALEAIRAALGLDYGGIDFGIDAAGNVIVFEANATMAVFYPDDDERFAYRRPAVDRVIAAFRAMLIEKASSAGYTAGGASPSPART